jgi:hypothetical protein
MLEHSDVGPIRLRDLRARDSGGPVLRGRNLGCDGSVIIGSSKDDGQTWLNSATSAQSFTETALRLGASGAVNPRTRFRVARRLSAQIRSSPLVANCAHLAIVAAAQASTEAIVPPAPAGCMGATASSPKLTPADRRRPSECDRRAASDVFIRERTCIGIGQVTDPAGPAVTIGAWI